MLVIHSRILLVVKWYLVSLHEIVAKVDWQGLRILHLLFCFVRHILMIYVFLGHSFYVGLGCSSRNLFSRPWLVTRILTLSAGSSIWFLLLLVDRSWLLFIASTLVGGSGSRDNWLCARRRALYMLQMLVDILLLEQVLQSSLCLTIQMSSCCSLDRIVDRSHWLVLLAALSRSTWLLLGMQAACNVVSQSCRCQLLMMQRSQVLRQYHLLLQLLNQ